MKTLGSYLRVTLVTVLAYFLLDNVVDTGDAYTYGEYPILWAVLAFVFIFALAIEYSVAALKNVLFRAMSPEQQERFEAQEATDRENQFAGIKRIYKKLVGTRPIEEEGEIILDHNYDGIKELDNKLPPWWLYGFYLTIIFAAVYLARFHIFDGYNQAEEFEIQMEEARLAIEEYKKTAKNLVDASTVELLTDAEDLSAGKVLFSGECVACHKADGGGGIGPNLTDQYWILGGGIKNVFNTISEGGRAGKGMIAWKNDFSPAEIAQLASYVLSLQGTTPAEPKEAEGELWTETAEVVSTDEVKDSALDTLKTESVTIDSTDTQVEVIMNN